MQPSNREHPAARGLVRDSLRGFTRVAHGQLHYFWGQKCRWWRRRGESGTCQKPLPCSSSERKHKKLQRGLGAPKWAAESLNTGWEWLWGWSSVRDEDRVGLVCPLGLSGCEDPMQLPLVDTVEEWAVGNGELLVFQSGGVDTSHPSAADGVSQHQDILCIFLAALGHHPDLHWGGCVTDHWDEWWITWYSEE